MFNKLIFWLVVFKRCCKHYQNIFLQLKNRIILNYFILEVNLCKLVIKFFKIINFLILLSLNLELMKYPYKPTPLVQYVGNDTYNILLYVCAKSNKICWLHKIWLYF